MIFQGLFNIFELYFDRIDLFYDNINSFFYSRVKGLLDKEFEKNTDSVKIIDKVRKYLINIFIDLDFEKEEIEQGLFCPKLNNRIEKMTDFSSDRLYNILIEVINEIFLKKLFDYLINPNSSSSLIDLKSKSLLPFEFMMEIKNLRDLFEREPDKVANLKKYIHIGDNIFQKLKMDSIKIEEIQEYNNPTDKLQLFYMIYRIIDFFSFQRSFNSDKIKNYIKNNCEEWLESIPLVSLKNPDLYFCGIYLIKHLAIDIEEEVDDLIKYHLLNIYDENIDEFEAPILEATNQVYYFLKSSDICDLGLSEGQIKELLKGDDSFFRDNYLKSFETSQLVVILKIYQGLGVYHFIEPKKIRSIIEEIQIRITKDGITQYRDGFMSSEATYYVLFFKYMLGTLGDLENYEILGKTITKIYRNLEILEISENTNRDLISEIFYSCEILKLLNCIETKHAIIHLARFLFPKDVIKRIMEYKNITHPFTKICHLKVNSTTGETIYY